MNNSLGLQFIQPSRPSSEPGPELAGGSFQSSDDSFSHDFFDALFKRRADPLIRDLLAKSRQELQCCVRISSLHG
jgi:hypothetical protein